MLFCNPNNQAKFATYLNELITRIVPLDQGLPSGSRAQLSGFLNQLILQVFLEDQTLTVNFQRKSTVFKIACNSSLGLLTHPRYGTGSGCRCIEVSLLRTCTELINSLSDIPISQIINRDKLANSAANNKNSTNSQAAQLVADTNNSLSSMEMNDILTNLKNFSESSTDGKQAHQQQAKASIKSDESKLRLFLKVSESREILLPNEMSLWNVLRLFLSQSKSDFVRDLTLTIQLTDGVLSESSTESGMTSENITPEIYEHLNSYAISSPLDEFVKSGGLITLAERLPILMPFIQEPLLNITEKDRNQVANENNASSKTSPDFVDYVIMNESDEPFVDDIYNDVPMNTNTMNQTSKLKKITMPPYSFVAFGLFLKIPGYAKVMLKNRRQAQCILKLLLGKSLFSKFPK